VADDTYYASVRQSAVAADKRHLAIFNGVGSGKILRVYRITAFSSPVATVSGLIVPLGVIKTTSPPTDGGILAVAKAKATNPDVPAELLVRSAPTTGTVEPIAFGGGTVSAEETQASTEVLYEAPIDGSQAVECLEGAGFEVRQLTLPSSVGAISIIAVIGLIPAV